MPYFCSILLFCLLSDYRLSVLAVSMDVCACGNWHLSQILYNLWKELSFNIYFSFIYLRDSTPIHTGLVPECLQ